MRSKYVYCADAVVHIFRLLAKLFSILVSNFRIYDLAYNFPLWKPLLLHDVQLESFSKNDIFKILGTHPGLL